VAAGDHFGIERDLARPGLARASRVGRTKREAVDVRAIERRYVDRRGQIVGQYAAQRPVERNLLRGQW